MPYWLAFQSLKDDRQFGAMGGMGPISYLSISKYLDDHGIADPDERDEYEHLIGAMDDEFIRFHAKKPPAE